jgi:hypothetical protein
MILAQSRKTPTTLEPVSMNCDKEIYGIASVYLRERGEDAVIHAAMRADALLDAGDMDGQRVWLRVIDAIKVLSRMEKLAAAKIH